MGGMSGLEMTPVLCLIPIFNASQMIRGILLGDVSTGEFRDYYGGESGLRGGRVFFIATRQFENGEWWLFRS